MEKKIADPRREMPSPHPESEDELNVAGPEYGGDHGGGDKSRSETDRKKPFVLFICTHNSARSRMAEGYLQARYGDRFTVGSAGTEPRAVNPVAVTVMKEIGIDISGQRSRLTDEFFERGVDIVVTVCDSASGACPFFPGSRRILHAGFPDPSACTGSPEECLAVFRDVRDGLIAWIENTFVPGFPDRLPVS